MKVMYGHLSKARNIFKQIFNKNDNTLLLHAKQFITEKLLSASLSKNGISTIKINHNNYLKNKIDGLVVWYEEVSGLDEVKWMQNRVIDAQDKFVKANERRIEASACLNSVQIKLKDIRSELDTATKGEDRYLHLITQEHALLKEERQLIVNFKIMEKEERDCFSFLSSAVKESHNKERAHAERTKYWSVIGSIFGTVIGVVGSSINNEFKMRELRKLVILSVENRYGSSATQYNELLRVANEIKSAVDNKTNGTDKETIEHNLNNSLKNGHLTETLQQYRKEIKVVILASAIFFVIHKLF